MNKHKTIRMLLCFTGYIIITSVANASEVYNQQGNKLDLYGKVDARHVFSDNIAEDGDNTYIRLGFKGQTKINDTLTGYGQWEYNFNGNNTEGGADVQKGNATRLGLAGLKLEHVGSFEYGRGWGVLYDPASYTDIMPIYGGNTWVKNDNFMTKRSTGLFTYRNKDVFGAIPGMKFALQYQGKNDRSDVTRANGDGVGASTEYDFGDGISIAGALGQSNRTLIQQADGLGTDASAWTTAIKYDANLVYLAAMYSETKNMTPYGQSLFASKTKNIELVAQYQFLNGLRPSLGFLLSRGSNLSAATSGANKFSGGDATLLRYIEAGVNYYLNKNMVFYADYKINLLNDNDFTKTTGVNTDDSMGVGLIYQF